MTTLIDFSELTSEPAQLEIGVLESNRAVLHRAARSIRAAAQLAWIAAEEDPSQLAARLSKDASFVACEEAAAEAVLGWCEHQAPNIHLAVWSHDPTAALIDLAAHNDRIVSVLGWPSFQSMPRPWELALATRRILRPESDPTFIGDILPGSPVAVEFHPRTPADRVAVVAHTAALVERAGCGDRTASRIGDVMHELTMNATFDAPVDSNGDPRYAHDRRAPVELEDDEVPLVQFATDGMLAVLAVTDGFGRLTRDHVIASIQRGCEAGRSSIAEVVDSSRGGAGLGFWRIYSSAAATIVDIIPGHSTSVTAVFDIDLSARDARNLPPSLHLFDRGRLG